MDRPVDPQDVNRGAALRALKAMAVGANEQVQRQATTSEAAAPAGAQPNVTAQVAQAVTAQSNAAEPVARRGEAAPIDPRVTIAAEGVASAERSQEQNDPSQHNGTGQSSSPGVPREIAASRPLDLPASTGGFALAAPDPASRPVLQAVTPFQPFTPAQETENAARLIESMRVQWRQGIPEATVRLNPEHLGEVTISIRVERGAVSATIHAETPAVQEWLESQAEKLRAGLADQGLSLERFVVQRERQQERRDQRQQPAPRYRQAQEQGQQRFEVTV